MAGKVKLAEKSIKTSAYTVSGTTLAEIWADIQAKGPKDGGAARAGYTTCPVTTPQKVDFDGEVKEDKKSGDQAATVWIKSAEVSIECTIQVPKLASDKDLSDEAKKEWKRFLTELVAHEAEHVKVSKAEAKKIADELGELTGSGSDKDKKKAIAAAQADFAKTLKSKFGGSTVDNRLKKVNAALDSGGHGPVLKTSIP
jgi:predicted secreted Zn-dependent protease